MRARVRYSIAGIVDLTSMGIPLDNFTNLVSATEVGKWWLSNGTMPNAWADPPNGSWLVALGYRDVISGTVTDAPTFTGR